MGLREPNPPSRRPRFRPRKRRTRSLGPLQNLGWCRRLVLSHPTQPHRPHTPAVKTTKPSAGTPKPLPSSANYPLPTTGRSKSTGVPETPVYSPLRFSMGRLGYILSRVPTRIARYNPRVLARYSKRMMERTSGLCAFFYVHLSTFEH
jgi:hypothetical protein